LIPQAVPYGVKIPVPMPVKVEIPKYKEITVEKPIYVKIPIYEHIPIYHHFAIKSPKNLTESNFNNFKKMENFESNEEDCSELKSEFNKFLKNNNK
jgi:hypothetical protein